MHTNEAKTDLNLHSKQIPTPKKMIWSTKTSSTIQLLQGFEKKNTEQINLEKQDIFRIVSNRTAKISANYNMPSSIKLLITLLFDFRGNILQGVEVNGEEGQRWNVDRYKYKVKNKKKMDKANHTFSIWNFSIAAVVKAIIFSCLSGSTSDFLILIVGSGMFVIYMWEEQRIKSRISLLENLF